MKETVGFIGLGGMGLPMATNLLKAGFGLRVYNRTADKARPLLEQGAMLARSPAEAAAPGGIVVTIVSDDRARLRRARPADWRACTGSAAAVTSPRRFSASPRWRPGPSYGS
jgi:3-hydroxyisobutyrate dehydrogenase-like beta-hydroxyacid dehydrogenase